MAFSENIKTKVKELSAFKCCRCQSIGIDIHHIIPQKDCGSEDIDNAAPLCPNCHDYFGDNPVKRKEIMHMRDWWYKQVEKIYSATNLKEVESINNKLEEIKNNQSGALSELKAELFKINEKLIDNITPETAGATATNIVNSSIVSSTKLGENVHANFICKNCNTQIGLLIGSNSCPNCGLPIQ